MSALLSCRDLHKGYGGRALFDGLTLAVHEGERVGLVGPNGSGKTTLLRVLAGLEPADDGGVAVRNGVRVAYFAQEEEFPAGLSVEDVVLAAFEDGEGEALDEVTRGARARITLGKTGFTEFDQPASQLSGGWRKRLALARVLVTDPDLVLLDEPTNHLDLSGIVWLEKLLEGSSFATLFVSHDRYLLERVANRVVEVGRHLPNGHLRVEGNYSDFLLARDELLEVQQNRERALANTVRREVEWLRRGPRGRGTKKKDRIDQAHATMRELSDVRARNTTGGAAEIEFSATGRRTQDLLVGKGLTKRLGEQLLFHDLDLALGPGDRVGLVGDNGSGKSTLLKTLAGELEPDAGSVKRAVGLRTVVFHQDRKHLDPESTLKEVLCPEGDTVRYAGRDMHVTGWARRFRFEPEQLSTRVGALSGGERARLGIADLVRQPADVLFLDEPTNDLDLTTRDVLEESLLEFPGAIVLVTHDRYMLERVCTGLVGLDGRGESFAVATLDQWFRAQEQANREAQARAKAKAARTAGAASPAATAPRRPRSMNYKDRRELDGMEDAIMAAEAQVEELQQRVAAPDVLADHVRLNEAYAELHAAEQRVERLYTRWQELEAIKNALA